VAFDLARDGPAWNFETRLLASADLEPPAFATWRLPGASAKDAERLAGRLARVEALAGLVPKGYQPRVRVSFPRGAPHASLSFSASFVKGKTQTGTSVDLGRIPIEPRGVETVERLLSPVSVSDLGAPGALPNGVVVTIGTSSRTFPTFLDAEAPSIFEHALRLTSALDAGRVASSDHEVAAATLERGLVDLGARMDAGDPSAATARKRVSEFASACEAGKDPLRFPGVLDLARRSSVDGAPQPFELHVPASYRPDAGTRYPLVVLLHGYDGTPERIMTAFLGTDSKRPRPGVDGFIVAPGGHGNAFYRGPGETDVMETIDWVISRYPIDADRVSIAGHSMGGTGAAELAFKYPDRFSAVSALAGYHSYFVRRDVQGRSLRAWEWAEAFRFSPASWAENGRDLPLYVAQGTEDKPVAHSEVLVERYRSLGFSVFAEWPEIGHDVWRIAWSGAKQWPMLSTRRAVRSPKRVTLTTNSLATSRRAWAELVELERPGFPGTLDAKIVAPDHFDVKVTSATAFRLARPEPHVARDAAVTVTINGADLRFDGAERLEAHRSATGWVRGILPPSPGLSKRAGLEGPLRDAFRGPLAFVYGTLDPRQTRAAREVAEHFRARYSGDARFPVVADVALPKALASTHSLFVVGSAASNAVLKALDAMLPLGITQSGARVGDKVVTVEDAALGILFVHPNPRNPSRYVVALEARNARGLYTAMSLPLLLPDFVVFDSRVSSAAGQQVLGDSQVVAAGYFDGRWALPADYADVIAVPAGRDAARFRP
jgi:predicted esterase